MNLGSSTRFVAQSVAVGQQVWVTTGAGNTLVAIAPASD